MPDVDMGGTEPSVQGEDLLSNDEIYNLLSDSRRRFALHYLKQHNEPVDVSELAERIAAWENDKAVSELTSQERKRVYISLYQSHLQTLDNKGAVDYDEDRKIVELDDSIANSEIYLEVVPKKNIPWSYYYIGLSIAGMVVTGLAALDFSYFGEISGIAYAVLFLFLVSSSAVIQTYQRRRMRLGDYGPPPSTDLAK